MAAEKVVKTLSALVRVQIMDADGKPVYRISGVDEHGKAMTEPAVRFVTVTRGQPLPDHLAKGEAERLDRLGALGTAEEAAQIGARRPSAA